MARKKIFLAGEVFKLTDPVTVTEMCMQMRLDNWLGKGTVTVKLNKPNNDELEITISRKYGSFYGPTSFESQPPIFRSIFETKYCPFRHASSRSFLPQIISSEKTRFVLL